MMNHYERFLKTKLFTDRVGPIYGTEDFGIYLYSVIKMMRPKNILELGTGLGTTMLWAAQAILENNEGIIHTFDDGSEWNHLKNARDQMGEYFREDYLFYIENLIDSFEIRKAVEFHPVRIEEIESEAPIDILFSDFAHGPSDVLQLLAEFLPQMNSYSKIYIDSASTHYGSYHTLEKVIDMLNQNTIPRSISERAKNDTIRDIVNQSQFQLDHIVENKDRAQNSTTCITIQPYDVFPYPRVNVRY